MKFLWLIILFLMICLTYGQYQLPNKNNTPKPKNKSGSVWKHEIDYPPLTTKSGLRSQVFYLILYIDGTYDQQVFLIPENPEDYKGIRYYELKGKWNSNEKELILIENGKEEHIDNNTFYSKFENVDNIIVIDK